MIAVVIIRFLRLKDTDQIRKKALQAPKTMLTSQKQTVPPFVVRIQYLLLIFVSFLSKRDTVSGNFT